MLIYGQGRVSRTATLQTDLPLASLFTPVDLIQLPAAFDHDHLLFELKMDGIRFMGTGAMATAAAPGDRSLRCRLLQQGRLGVASVLKSRSKNKA